MVKQAAETLAGLVAKTGASALVGNLETQMLTGKVGRWTIPVSRNEGLQRTCYINCPSRAFLDYGIEELDRLTPNPVFRLGGRAVIKATAPLVQATGLDRQVQLNNWLVATNILPRASADDWLLAFDELGQLHPGYVPVLRSVNQAVHGALLAQLIEAGLTAFPIRKVFIRNYADDRRWTSDEAKDADLLAHSDLVRRPGTDFTSEAFERAADLYAQLYLEKYSALNPHYTAWFLQAAQEQLGLVLEGLFNEREQMVGVIGRFVQHGMLTGPIVGYDRKLPRKLGLYRQLRAINHAAARQGELLYNMSAGAEGFKRLRGGRATVEFMVADFRRMPRSQRLAASTLSAISHAAARPLMRRDQAPS